MAYPVTTATAGIFGLMLVALSFGVVNIRRLEKIAFGAGNCKLLELRIRAQANFIEYAPLSLILLYLVESQGLAPKYLLIVNAVMLIAGRVLHSYAFVFEHAPAIHMTFRPLGTVLTLSSMIISSIVLLISLV